MWLDLILSKRGRRDTYRTEWERPSITNRNQIELLITKCINWLLSDWIAQRLWLEENLNFSILISFFHYLEQLLQLFEGLGQVKKLSDIKTTQVLSGSPTRNWYSSKIPLESKTTVSCDSFWLSGRVSLITYRVEHKLDFPGQINKIAVISYRLWKSATSFRLTCRIELLILILLNDQDKTSSLWNYWQKDSYIFTIPIATRVACLISYRRTSSILSCDLSLVDSVTLKF